MILLDKEKNCFKALKTILSLTSSIYVKINSIFLKIIFVETNWIKIAMFVLTFLNL